MLPPGGCKLAVPAWPASRASAVEAKLWRQLWSLPIACWWHAQATPTVVVARYVRLLLASPEHAAVGQAERELGMTPASMLRMRLVVEAPEAEPERGLDPYQHLKVVR